MKQLDPTSPAARDLESGRYRIRTLDAAGLASVVVPWMQAAGWNPGRHDARCFIEADPGGFLVGDLDGTPVASVSAVRYDDAFGFLGCYLVQEPFRGRGYGLAIHEAGRARLAGCTQGGDGVLDNVAKYRQIGRVLAGRNTRFETVKPAAAWPAPPPLPAARAVPFEALEALDRRCFPAPRPAFLRAWLHQPDAFTAAVLDAEEPGLARGFGVIRACHRGWKIGPLFARDPGTADTLFRGLVDRIPGGDPFVLDVPESNPAAVTLAGRYGMREVFATARMYTGPFPRITHDWVYGITTFELG